MLEQWNASANVCPKIRKKLLKNAEYANTCYAVPVGKWIFQVQYGDFQYNVDIIGGTVTAEGGIWQDYPIVMQFLAWGMKEYHQSQLCLIAIVFRHLQRLMVSVYGHVQIRVNGSKWLVAPKFCPSLWEEGWQAKKIKEKATTWGYRRTRVQDVKAWGGDALFTLQGSWTQHCGLLTEKVRA